LNKFSRSGSLFKIFWMVSRASQVEGLNFDLIEWDRCNISPILWTKEKTKKNSPPSFNDLSTSASLTEKMDWNDLNFQTFNDKVTLRIFQEFFLLVEAMNIIFTYIYKRDCLYLCTYIPLSGVNCRTNLHQILYRPPPHQLGYGS